MTRLATAAALALLFLPSCSGQSTPRAGGTGGSGSGGNNADAPAIDRPSDTTGGSGGAPDVGRDVVVEVAADAPTASDAALCPSESDNGATSPSGPACAATPMTVNAASLCAGAATCPVGAVHALTCTGGGYGPWVVPTGPGGSVMFVTNTGRFVTRLFTMVPGATAEVNDVPGLTSATNALAADGDGNPTIFGGEMPGAWRVRKTPQGWGREHAVEVGSGLAMVTDGVAVDANQAFIAYYNLDDGAPRLAIRDGACWRSTLLSGAHTAFMSLDLDSMNRPWTAWFTSVANGGVAVDLAGPDGPHRVWTSPSAAAGGLMLRDRPVVLARGLTGVAAYPALAIQRPDAVHVLVPEGAPGAAPTWTDRVVPSSALVAPVSDCPVQAAPFLNGCGGRTSCQSSIKGVIGGFGAARTTAGRTYAAWLASDGASTYSLSPPITSGPLCAGIDQISDGGSHPMVPPTCMCAATVTASHGTATIVLSRIDTAVPTEALHVNFDTGGELRAGTLALAARGNTLLIVASVGRGTNTELRYLEVDTTSLP